MARGLLIGAAPDTLSFYIAYNHVFEKPAAAATTLLAEMDKLARDNILTLLRGPKSSVLDGLLERVHGQGSMLMKEAVGTVPTLATRLKMADPARCASCGKIDSTFVVHSAQVPPEPICVACVQGLASMYERKDVNNTMATAVLPARCLQHKCSSNGNQWSVIVRVKADAPPKPFCVWCGRSEGVNLM